MAEYRGESEDAGVGMWLGVPPRSSSEVLIDFISLNLVHWLQNPGSCYLAVVEPGCCSVLSDSWQPHGCSMPVFSVLHHLLEFAQTQVH